MPRRAVKNASPRSQVMTFRVTSDEQAAIAADAGMAEMTVSGFLTALVVGRKLRFVQSSYQRMDPAVLAELRRIGNNLNQLAHAANTGLPVNAITTIAAAHELVRSIVRHELDRQMREAPRAEPAMATDNKRATRLAETSHTS